VKLGLMGAATPQLRCLELTEPVEENVSDAIRWLGQLSGRLIAVEGFIDGDDERVLERVPVRCGMLWLIEELSGSDLAGAGPRARRGLACSAWRARIGDLALEIWADASCLRRSARIEHAGRSWWRAQLNVFQPRPPHHLWYSDCTLDPPGSPHQAPLRFDLRG